MGGFIFLLKDLIGTVLAQGDVTYVEPSSAQVVVEAASLQLNDVIANYSIWSVYAAAASLGLLILIAIAIRYPSESAKRILFWSITGIITLTTTALVGMTIYLNQSSVSGGPVHWHADFQIWACDNKLDIKDPEGLSSSVGTSTLHEHNEDRIHVEGVVVDYKDVNLGAFFKVVGGGLTNKSITVPTNEGNKSFINGQICNNSAEEAVLQTFILEADLENKTYTQRKISDPQNYLYKKESQVPPGDCVIFEFTKEKDKTDKICQTYLDSLDNGKLIKEVPYDVTHRDNKEEVNGT